MRPEASGCHGVPAARVEQARRRACAEPQQLCCQHPQSAGTHARRPALCTTPLHSTRLLLQHSLLHALLAGAPQPHLDAQPPHLRAGVVWCVTSAVRQGAGSLWRPVKPAAAGRAQRHACPHKSSLLLPTHLLHEQEDFVAPRGNVLLQLVQLQARKVLDALRALNDAKVVGQRHAVQVSDPAAAREGEGCARLRRVRAGG